MTSAQVQPETIVKDIGDPAAPLPDRLKYFRPDGSPAYELAVYRTILTHPEVAEILRANENLEARPDDVIVASYPKSGTTWTQAIVEAIMFDEISTVSIFGLDTNRWCNLYSMTPSAIAARPSPRLMKMHVPLTLYPQSLIEKKCKIIYVRRNVKDVMVSMYHWCRNAPHTHRACPSGSFAEFAEAFMDGQVPAGSYFNNLAAFWSHRDDPNILMLTYEEMSQNPHQTVGKIADFLGRPMGPQQVARIVEATSFGEMKKKEKGGAENGNATGESSFLRSGSTEQWRTTFDPELLQKVDSWIQRSIHLRDNLSGYIA
ncbi:putative Sulfotransferase 1C4 [Hypsibius exemplaris]|uniref:Sulfotransferase 1C4 n=1 Tax=Hypsibius exemplaris TaxID=2072580 RepID=A0A1W0WI77_HYPEX|nr:putative Sulfotransferase 1C4 [Hypsibius exemplaris]